MTVILKFDQYHHPYEARFDTLDSAINAAAFAIEYNVYYPVQIEDESGKVLLDRSAIETQWEQIWSQL